MANHYEKARTSYFAVRDKEKFLEWANSLPGVNEIVESTAAEKKVTGVDPTTPLYAFLFSEDSGVPTLRVVTQSVHGEDDGETVDEDIDFVGELSEHLADGWVAEVRAIGYEKMRCLDGWAAIVNSNGEAKEVNFNDLDAGTLGPHATACEE